MVSHILGNGNDMAAQRLSGHDQTNHGNRMIYPSHSDSRGHGREAHAYGDSVGGNQYEEHGFGDWVGDRWNDVKRGANSLYDSGKKFFSSPGGTALGKAVGNAALTKIGQRGGNYASAAQIGKGYLNNGNKGLANAALTEIGRKGGNYATAAHLGKAYANQGNEGLANAAINQLGKKGGNYATAADLARGAVKGGAQGLSNEIMRKLPQQQSKKSRAVAEGPMFGNMFKEGNGYAEGGDIRQDHGFGDWVKEKASDVHDFAKNHGVLSKLAGVATAIPGPHQPFMGAASAGLGALGYGQGGNVREEHDFGGGIGWRPGHAGGDTISQPYDGNQQMGSNQVSQQMPNQQPIEQQGMYRGGSAKYCRTGR